MSFTQSYLKYIVSSNVEVDAWEIAPRFSDLLANTSIQFVQDKVKLLNPCDHYDVKNPSCCGTVYLESGLHIEYDWYFFSFLSVVVYP